MLLQATVLHRFAPGTSSTPGTSGATDVTDSVSSPLAGPSGKTVSLPKSPTFSLSSLPCISSPLSVSSVHEDSPALGQFPRSPVPQKKRKLSSAARKLSSCYTQSYVPPFSKEISKILSVVTTIENKIDHLTDLIIANGDDGEHFDRFDSNILTIHDDVNDESSVSEQSGSNAAKNPGSSLQTAEPSSDQQVTLINDSIVQLRHQSSSATSFAVKLVRQMFETHELVGRNVSGVRGKKPLDGNKITKIREIVCQFYPAPTAEAMETWKNCRKAIDSFLRKNHNVSNNAE